GRRHARPLVDQSGQQTENCDAGQQEPNERFQEGEHYQDGYPDDGPDEQQHGAKQIRDYAALLRHRKAITCTSHDSCPFDSVNRSSDAAREHWGEGRYKSISASGRCRVFKGDSRTLAIADWLEQG